MNRVQAGADDTDSSGSAFRASERLGKELGTEISSSLTALGAVLGAACVTWLGSGFLIACLVLEIVTIFSNSGRSINVAPDSI